MKDTRKSRKLFKGRVDVSRDKLCREYLNKGTITGDHETLDYYSSFEVYAVKDHDTYLASHDLSVQSSQ